MEYTLPLKRSLFGYLGPSKYILFGYVGPFGSYTVGKERVHRGAFSSNGSAVQHLGFRFARFLGFRVEGVTHDKIDVDNSNRPEEESSPQLENSVGRRSTGAF